MQAFKELLETSLKEKKGLTLHVNGANVVGYVVKIADDGSFVELRNRTESRVIVLLDRVDAIGMS